MSTVRKIARYGWQKDLPDNRDLLFHEHHEVLDAAQLPGSVDLSAQQPGIYDQGQLGSCTGNGVARVLECARIRAGSPSVTPSRLFIYYEERVIEGTVSTDSGAQIRDGIKVVASEGAPPETDWPYDISQFAVRPPQAAYDAAKQDEAIEYQRIIVGGPGAPMRTALAAGFPIVFGFSVPSSFEDGSWNPVTDVLRLPDPGSGFIGGHCVVITGYDFTGQKYPEPYFICANSWGPGWGDRGYFRMAHEWFTPSKGLCDDLWIVSKAS